MNPELTIVFCVEKGFLEPQALSLAESIRLFGGDQDKLVLRAYSPRPGHHPTTETIRKLQAMDVEWIDEPLNTQLNHYPIANKLFALQHAERTARTGHVCFLDSDKFVFGPISPSLLSPGSNIGLRPVNRKGPGSTGPDDPNDPYWQRLIEQYGLDPMMRVETVVDGEAIRPYFNAGFVLVAAGSGFGDRWLQVLVEQAQTNQFPQGNFRCMDQIALAIVAGSTATILPSKVNVPLPFVEKLRARGTFLWPTHPISVHYFKYGMSPALPMWCSTLSLDDRIQLFVQLAQARGL